MLKCKATPLHNKYVIWAWCFTTENWSHLTQMCIISASRFWASRLMLRRSLLQSSPKQSQTQGTIWLGVCEAFCLQVIQMMIRGSNHWWHRVVFWWMLFRTIWLWTLSCHFVSIYTYGTSKALQQWSLLSISDSPIYANPLITVNLEAEIGWLHLMMLVLQFTFTFGLFLFNCCFASL